MKVLFLTPYPLGRGPNVRFRLECYLPFLEKAGIRYKVQSFTSKQFYGILYKKGYFIRKLFYTLLGYFLRFFHLIESLNYDVICILREVSPFGPAISPYLWRLLGKKIIFDFDDAIYLKNMSQVNQVVAFLKCPSKTKTFIHFSNQVIAGNDHLAKYARRYHSNVTVIPTPIDTSRFNGKDKKAGQNICIGWSGSWTTLPHFYLVKEELKELVKRFPFLSLKVFGTHVAHIPGISLEAVDWSLETELENLRSFDIGIMPLADDQWSRSKCGFKLLMYMALGIPTVSSAVGVNTEIVQDGVNGFLVSTPQEWIEKLSRLIKDPELRRRIAAQGRKTAEERYSVTQWAQEFVRVLGK